MSKSVAIKPFVWTAVIMCFCVLQFMSAAAAKADSLSFFKQELKKEQEKGIMVAPDGRETGTVTAEERAEALRQRKDEALDSLNKTLKQIDDREIARELRDGGVGIITTN